jgi:hypothetical protein
MLVVRVAQWIRRQTDLRIAGLSLVTVEAVKHIVIFLISFLFDQIGMTIRQIMLSVRVAELIWLLLNGNLLIAG